MNLRYAAAAAIVLVAVVASGLSKSHKSDGAETVENAVGTGSVDQGGSNADQVRTHLLDVKLPPGFTIELYAIVPGARHMAVAPRENVVWVGTRGFNVYVIQDRDRDRIADVVRSFAPSVEFSVPNGVCLSEDGYLYVVEMNRVLVFPRADSEKDSPKLEMNVFVPQGELIPREEESHNHGARVCKIGPDNRIYISLGQPFNVPPKGKRDLYNTWGIGGIIRINRDGTGREVYTYGARNSVGHDFHPITGELWWTDNQVDGMGDDIPPGELNHQTAAGQNFGFPWYGGGSVRTNEYFDEEPPPDAVFPAVETVAHAADLGMTFYTGNMFPAKYQNAIFSAQHGSWDRTTPVGARVMVTFIDNDGNAAMEPFAEGWIDPNGEYLGRPVDLAQLGDGSLLVSDDLAGALYRISYQEPK